MARIKMHIPKAKLPFYPSYEVKYKLQNRVSTHRGNMMNSLSPSGLITDWIGGSALSKPSLELPSGLSISKPSSLEEGKVADGFLSSLEVSGSF